MDLSWKLRRALRPLRSLRAVLAIAFLATAVPAAAADEAPAEGGKPSRDIRELSLFRFEFDNDTFLGEDNSFSAGWSFQLHSKFNDVWAPGYAKWIGKFPGLGDDGRGGRITRWAWGLSQNIFTPNDVSIEAFQPNDAPYAGTLGLSASWAAYDNKRLAALQAYVGCMGPCSGGESVQKFIHEDLGFGTPPEGWDHQIVQQWLGNLNYEYRYKIYAPAADRYSVPGRFAQDFSIGSQAGVGNFVTFGEINIEYRLGWGLPMGFTKRPDPPGWGIMLDPVYVDPIAPLPTRIEAWRAYFTVMMRNAWIAYNNPAEGGETVSGERHPGLHPYPGEEEVAVGLHLSRMPWAVHVTYYRYFNQDNVGIQGSSDWVNFSFEYRF